MKALSAWATALCFLCACADARPTGVRYRTERDLWRINQEYQRLSIKRTLVEPATWRDLAARYERVAAAVTATATRDGDAAVPQAVREVRALAARALVSAAHLQASVGDTLTMLHNFERVTTEFQDVQSVLGEVVLAQGRIAESQADWEKAAAAYERVVVTTTPHPGDPGVAGVVLDLPLRIARLRARTGASQGDSTLTRGKLHPEAYAAATRVYSEWITAQPNSRVEAEARLRLAEVAADQERWPDALAQLQQVEAQASRTADSNLDPGNIRLTTAMVQSRASIPPDSVRATLRSVVQDFPQSQAAPRALLAMAAQAAGQASVNEALEYLDELQSDYPHASSIGSQGMLMRSRILEREGRWAEAQDVLRALPVQHPLSEAALQAPLDVASHYARAQDHEETEAALERAEQEYRDLLARYPTGQNSLLVRTKLVQTLLLQKNHEVALGELLSMGEALQGSPQGAAFMLQAARLAHNELGDPPRAAQILERLGKLYPNMEIGRWASGEAARLREVNSE